MNQQCPACRTTVNVNLLLTGGEKLLVAIRKGLSECVEWVLDASSEERAMRKVMRLDPNMSVEYTLVVMPNGFACMVPRPNR